MRTALGAAPVLPTDGVRLGDSPTWTGPHAFSALVSANLGLYVAGGVFKSRGITDNATATALTIASTGAATFSAALVTASLGLTVAGAAFKSRGITDNATATFLTLASTGAVSLAAPSAATTLTVAGGTGGTTMVINGPGSGNYNILNVNGGSGSGTALYVTGAGGATSNPAMSVTSNGSNVALVVANGGSGAVLSTTSTGSGTALLATGASGTLIAYFTSGNSATAQINDVTIARAGSTINTWAAGPNIALYDTTNSTESLLQNSGGQTELWQYNGGTWKQMLKFTTAGAAIFSGPVSMNAAAVTGFGTPTGATRYSSFGGASATLAQTSAQLADVITVLKTAGLLAA